MYRHSCKGAAIRDTRNERAIRCDHKAVVNSVNLRKIYGNLAARRKQKIDICC